MEDIETARLLLRLIPLRAVHAALSGDLKALEQDLGATVPADLLEEPDVLRYAQARLAEDADYLPWSARAIILKQSTAMIGHVRFHSRPDPDYLRPYARHAVEFGYAVYAAHRRLGYAEEALAGLVQWAQRAHRVGRFVASVSPANEPSTNLVAKVGFEKAGEHADPIDGLEYVYLLNAGPKS
jgi:[ribosomal protein S5]-alanine N-acetyltransferase